MPRQGPTLANASGRLPWKVLRSVATSFRVAPPGNREAIHRQWPREVIARLERLPPALWALDVDWRAHAAELDRLARVAPAGRSPKQETADHAYIATSLRKAAGKLRAAEGQADPLLIATLCALARFKPDRFGSLATLAPLYAADGPRLSEFLEALGAWIGGEERLTDGFHDVRKKRPSVGPNGAALQAYRNLAAFLEDRCGKPHHELVKTIVEVYHPSADRNVDRSRSARFGKKRKK